MHSEYSTLDGMGKIRELITTAKNHGQTFCAITDHGTMSGLWEAQKIGDELGIKVIHGCEFYWEYEDENITKGNGHLVVLAKNDVGLRNMYALHQWACKENFYRNPRINWEMLKSHSEGLIVTSACLASEFNQLIMLGLVARAKDWARKFHETFGDDFYIEVQSNQIPEQHLCNTTGIRIAEELGIELVATNDVHYTFADDCYPHEVLLAMQMRSKMDDPKRFKFSTEDFWLKSEDEMRETLTGISDAHKERALANTKVIADKCTTRIEKGHYLPKFYDTKESTPRKELVKHIKAGIEKRRLEGFYIDEPFLRAVQEEVNVIDRNGYSDYFLVVQDFVNDAKERGELVGDGRGSGAGSKVAWVTGITEIPPHHYDLLFERFMADGREPDFDVDFSDQQAVFRDLQKKYGVENVSRIIAFGKMTPKAVARKVFNTFGHSAKIQSEITSLIPEGCKDLFEEIAKNNDLKRISKEYRNEFNVIARLQNVISHLSQHAGGVLIYPGLGSTLPLGWDRAEGIHVAGFDKYMLEELGHFKFDILGLETLPVVRMCLDSIEASTGKRINLARIDMESPGVYQMLSSGDVSGVFQIAEQATKVIEQRPENFKDLIAINALIRPGVGDWEEYLARRKGKEYDIYPPRLPYMEETVGTMTYQEQFLLDAKTLAGWDIAYADKHIRKNKDIRNDDTLRRKFLEDGMALGQPKDVLEAVWMEIEDAVDGGYSFNKSHSASYAVLSYQTAWLKYHYPEHYYAALMSGCKTDGEGQNEVAKYMAECKQKGIQILPPDINHSGNRFTVTEGGIAYRITTIKGVGDSAIAHINDLRPFTSFDDLLGRRTKSLLKNNVIENLIKAGAFDTFGNKREDLLWALDMSKRTKTQIKEGYICPRYEVDDMTYMEWEKEVLGMYLSAHPMERYGFQPLSSFKDGMDGAIIGGEVVDVFEFHPKKDPARPKMAFVSLNTLYGTVKVICFAHMWSRNETRLTLRKGNMVLIKGKRSGNDIILNEMEVLSYGKQ